jgi:(1->4)-alpha-D-glucan 1-alpha-D-glucosylmutase
VNSLAQTLLKLTCPGVPDIYQGTELWDASLVDPDNRRGVDFAARRALLRRLEGATPEEVMADGESGLPKLWLIQRALSLRRSCPRLLAGDAAYRPVEPQGSRARHVVAFLRGEGVMTVVPRLVMGLRAGWGDTSIDLPSGAWRNVLTGEEGISGRVGMAALLRRFPVGLLVRS